MGNRWPLMGYMATIVTVFSYFTHSRLKLRGLHLAVLLRLTSSEVKLSRKSSLEEYLSVSRLFKKGFFEGC